MGLYGNLTLGGLKQLLAQHAPVLYMHPRDKFMPCSVEWFMDHSELWLRGSEQGGADTLLLSQGEVTGIGIARFQKQHSGQRLQLRLNPNAKQGPPPEEVSSMPLYGNAKWVIGRDGVAEALEVQYLTFYAHNGWYDIGYIGLLKVGAHDGDWEHLTVRLSASTGSLQGVYCNAHRSRDGCWVDASQVEQTPEGRLKLYVARHGHGTYPKAGVWWRAGLMANDLTSDKGVVWEADTVYLLPQLKPQAGDQSEQHKLSDALPIIATEMEKAVESGPGTASSQQTAESAEVNVLQSFIGGDDRDNPWQPAYQAQGGAANDDIVADLMEVPSRGSKLKVRASPAKTFSGLAAQRRVVVFLGGVGDHTCTRCPSMVLGRRASCFKRDHPENRRAFLARDRDIAVDGALH